MSSASRLHFEGFMFFRKFFDIFFLSFLTMMAIRTLPLRIFSPPLFLNFYLILWSVLVLKLYIKIRAKDRILNLTQNDLSLNLFRISEL